MNISRQSFDELFTFYKEKSKVNDFSYFARLILKINILKF